MIIKEIQVNVAMLIDAAMLLVSPSFFKPEGNEQLVTHMTTGTASKRGTLHRSQRTRHAFTR